MEIHIPTYIFDYYKNVDICCTYIINIVDVCSLEFFNKFELLYPLFFMKTYLGRIYWERTFSKVEINFLA